MVASARGRIDLVNGPVWRSVFLFALPIMLGQLLQQLYSTADGIIVGNFVSEDALAAMGSCITYSFVYLAVAIGLSNGSGIIVSQYYGAGRHEEMRRTASTILMLMLVLGAALTVLCVATVVPAARYVLRITEDEIRGYAVTYISIYALGFIFQFVYNAVAAILRSVGDSRPVLYFLLVATVTNVALDLLFVAVFRWGVAGAAVATVISQLGCVAVSLWYMFKNYPEFRFKKGELVFDRAKFRLCLRMGIPTTVQHLIISCGHLVLQRLVNSFGRATMAAVTVGTRYDHYCSIPIMGIMQAMSAFAGQNTGAGRYDRVKSGLKYAVLTDLIMVVVICAAMFAFARPLSALFGVEGESLDQSVMFLRFMSLSYPVFAAYIPFNGLFQGCGDPMSATFVSLVALTGRVGASYIMAYVFDMGYSSCWRGYIIGWTLSLVFAVCMFATGRWRTKALVRKSEGGGEKRDGQ